MAKFEHDGTLYKPQCIKCGSSNVTMLENSKGFQFRCNKCKTKTRFYGNLAELLRNPGMFKPNPTVKVKVDEEMRENHKRENGELTASDREFLASLAAERAENDPSAVWTLLEERWEPCWEELAEAWELYDPQTKASLAYMDEPIEDCGRLKCIPVKKATSMLTNSTYIVKREAEEMASLLGVRVFEERTGGNEGLAGLLEIVSRVDWAKA